MIDGKSYSCNATISENYRGCIRYKIEAGKGKDFLFPDKILEMHVYGYSYVSKLEKGMTFDSDDIIIDNIENGYVVSLYEKEYEVLDGSINILTVDRYKVKIEFKELRFVLQSSSNLIDEDYTPSNPSVHTVNGTVTFTNSIHDYDGRELPFF